MAAIRCQTPLITTLFSEQVDNVRRMLLAMVDDFRCVVIKLAERIAHLREAKEAPEDEACWRRKNVPTFMRRSLIARHRATEVELKTSLLFPLPHPAEYKRIAKLLHERRPIANTSKAV